jgi:hypothetical protein
MPRPVADDCRRVETRHLPPPGGRTGLRCGDIATATLLRDDSDVVKVAYRWRNKPGERWREARQVIRLTFLPCYFGGYQTFLCCPSCQRKAFKLYHHPAGENASQCRHCGRLVPRAQSEGSWQRALRRAAKIRRYCGGDGDLSAPFPAKPKQMRWDIYHALRGEALRLERLPASAWLASGSGNVRLGVRRDRTKRRWWPSRDAASRVEPQPR